MLLTQKMSIGNLRRQLPDWTWAAERRGMGWSYKGTRPDDDRTLTVYACSVLAGQFDDDFRTQWYMDDGHYVGPFRAWTQVGLQG